MESLVAVVAEGELDEAVAECADAVVEEDGVGRGTWKTLAACEVKNPTLSLQRTERQGWGTLGLRWKSNFMMVVRSCIGPFVGSRALCARLRCLRMTVLEEKLVARVGLFLASSV